MKVLLLLLVFEFPYKWIFFKFAVLFIIILVLFEIYLFHLWLGLLFAWYIRWFLPKRVWRLLKLSIKRVIIVFFSIVTTKIIGVQGIKRICMWAFLLAFMPVKLPVFRRIRWYFLFLSWVFNFTKLILGKLKNKIWTIHQMKLFRVLIWKDVLKICEIILFIPLTNLWLPFLKEKLFHID